MKILVCDVCDFEQEKLNEIKKNCEDELILTNEPLSLSLLDQQDSIDGISIVKFPEPTILLPFMVLIFVPETNLSCFLPIEVFTVLICSSTYVLDANPDVAFVISVEVATEIFPEPSKEVPLIFLMLVPETNLSCFLPMEVFTSLIFPSTYVVDANPETALLT